MTVVIRIMQFRDKGRENAIIKFWSNGQTSITVVRYSLKFYETLLCVTVRYLCSFQAQSCMQKSALFTSTLHKQNEQTLGLRDV